MEPVLLIGVGGTGNKTLRAMKQSLWRRLKQAGWKHDHFPTCWKMVSIDTVSTAVAEGFPAPLLDPGDYVGLTPPRLTFDNIVGGMATKLGPSSRVALATWCPRTSNVAVDKGAGQNRALGRAVSSSQLNRIYSALDSAYGELRGSGSDMAAVAELLDTNAGDKPIAFVISSVAGGTGSGMYLDVVEALKAVDMQLGEKAHVLLFGPDVFDPLLSSAAGRMIPANTLAAVNEVTSGRWNHNISEGTDLLFQSMEMAGALADGRLGIGSQANWLFGAFNAEGTLIGTLNEAYRAAGEAIAAVVSEPNIQDLFIQQLWINAIANSSNSLLCADRTGFKPDNSTHYTQPFGSFGTARVSLGLDAFTEFGSACLASEAVRRILWPQFHRNPPGDDRTATQLVSDQANIRWPDFLKESGLNERNPANEVVDALNPENAAIASSSFARDIINKVGAPQAGLRPADWINAILMRWQANEVAFLAQCRTDILTRAQKAAKGLQDQMTRHASVYTAMDGALVAASLLDKLVTEVNFVSTQELPVDAAGLRHRRDELPGILNSALNTGLAVIPANHQVLGTVVARLTELASFLQRAIRCEVAAELLSDMAENLLQPMATALRQNREALSIAAVSEQTSDGRPNDFLKYPTFASEVGPMYQAGPTELRLYPADTYPANLAQWIQDSLPADIRGIWQQRAIERTILGLPIDERGDVGAGDFLRFDRAWVPQNRDLHWAVGMTAQKALARVPRDPEAYVDRATGIITDRHSYIGKRVRESLMEYFGIIESDPALGEERIRLFTNYLVQAMSLSAPMAKLNVALAEKLHGGLQPNGFQVSSIPLVVGSAAQKQVAAALLRAKPHLGESKVNEWFNLTRAPHVEVFQHTGTLISSMVFDSVMKPIGQMWNSIAAQPDVRMGWWNLRRARPLSESLPISDLALSDMLKGWIVAGVLGLRSESDDDPARGKKVQLADGNDGNLHTFPHPLLGTMEDTKETLGRVLLSIGIAMAACNVSSSMDPLKPYQSLQGLGHDTTNGVNTALHTWIAAGTTKGPELPRDSVAGTPSDPWSVRQQAVLDNLKRTQALYEKDWAEIESSPDWSMGSLSWELRSQIRVAYESLIAQIAGMSLDEDDTR